MYWGVSNYILRVRPMEETNFSILLLLVFLASFCNADSYKYHDYKYNEYNYDQNYDYDNQKPEDYTEDYSQELNECYDQNLLAPPATLPIPPAPPFLFYFKYDEI